MQNMKGCSSCCENKKKVKTIIHCQRGKNLEVEAAINGGILEQDHFQLAITEYEMDGCRLGQIYLKFDNEVHTSCTRYLRVEDPVQVLLPMEEAPQSMTAMYMFNDWWTRPAFIQQYSEIPERTQVLFLKYADSYACMVPMVGSHFKTTLAAGTSDTIALVMNAGIGGQSEVGEPLYIMGQADTLQAAVEKVFTAIAKAEGIRMRKDRRLPNMFRYLGWCSWDAFYAEVSDDKVRSKARELTEKQVPVRWLLIDDGWLSINNKRLADYLPDQVKFPEGFRNLTADIKAAGMVDWIGVWHALGGYWCGIAPGSKLAIQEKDHIMKTVGDTLAPSPVSGERFYSDWYDVLQEEGIDFVKVDGQSSAAYYYENSMSISASARGIHKALEGGSSRMDGAVINCMGMAMENILARPTSALSRNSDDFVPSREGGFAEHLMQNAYNSLYHSMFYCCDWDMFWTKHPDCVKHSLLRAVSGGPVYFSDRIGDTNPQILKPLAYSDGELLMMDHSAMPTADCIFSDPLKFGVLKLHNVAPWGENYMGGGIAAYNLTGQKQTFSFAPADIAGITEAEHYWLLDYFSGETRLIGRNECFEGEMDTDGYGWYILLPQLQKGSCFGLMDKYAGFMAIENMTESDDATLLILRESGTIGWMAEHSPKSVMADGIDVTDLVLSKGCFYSVELPEKAKKTVLHIQW